MKEPYIEGVATHDDPESCTDHRKGAGEALTGARVGWVLSREISQTRVPRELHDPKATCAGASTQVPAQPCAVGDPMHARNLSAREPGDPLVTWRVMARTGRIGKAGAVIR